MSQTRTCGLWSIAAPIDRDTPRLERRTPFLDRRRIGFRNLNLHHRLGGARYVVQAAGRAMRNPQPDHRLLVLRQGRLAAGRHRPLVRYRKGDTGEKLAVPGIAWADYRAMLAAQQDGGKTVEPQRGLFTPRAIAANSTCLVRRRDTAGRHREA